MTYGQGEGPNDPWQPPQYNPQAHQKRITAPQQPYAPQGSPPPWGPGPYAPYIQQPPPQPPRRRRKWPIVLGVAVGLIVIGSIASALGSKPTQSEPPTYQAATQAAAPVQTQAPTTSAPAAPQTVTYIVTGSAADVTYGPSGSDYNGSVPIHVTKSIGSPDYYAINAQLQGGGTVSCKIEVDGKVISQATASGGYNIASCEIVQDPFSGAWQDANGA